ncbi:MAG: sporulation inhibitor KapD [Gemmataceae bacterium]|nr:sporulation inhibitor KapD [Gemmataceae bacterium]
MKTLFAVGRGLPAEVGLPQAVALSGLNLEGTHHRGHDDAWNIAGVLAELLQRLRK